jgi:hypothetical protein
VFDEGAHVIVRQGVEMCRDKNLLGFLNLFQVKLRTINHKKLKSIN